MSDDSRFPDDTAGPFPTPPRTLRDGEDRTIEIRRYDPSRRATLEAMYEAFDPADRAQGIPPTDPSRIGDWLETITGERTTNLVAWHDDRIVGHATLVPDEPDGMAELAIFVLQAYQGAGIGTHLLEALLGAGKADGVERVWLSVEQWNEPAIRLYENVGFRATDTESFEHEMGLRLVDQTESTG
jgi:RimJ/RimL family protein N-acetyltransferase